jgi:hypothetical protein
MYLLWSQVYKTRSKYVIVAFMNEYLYNRKRSSCPLCLGIFQKVWLISNYNLDKNSLRVWFISNTW